MISLNLNILFKKSQVLSQMSLFHNDFQKKKIIREKLMCVARVKM